MPHWMKIIGKSLVLNSGIATGLSLVVMLFIDTPSVRVFGWILAQSLIYSNVIGGLGWLVMERVAPLYWAKYPRRALARWSLVVTTLIAISGTGCLAAVGLIFLLGLGRNVPFWDFYAGSLKGSTLVTLVVGISITLYESYRDQLERKRRELQDKETERERALKLASEARLAAVSSRLHPHFLFNALNSISALIREDPARAERLLERFAALLRYSLDAHGGDLVPLAGEMKVVADYLEIEKARFAERLHYQIDCPPDLDSCEVPPFSIQTLVENSVKYAVGPRREGAAIQVAVARRDGRLVVEVADDGPGFSPEAMAAGHGLDNLHARLTSLFGAEAALDIARREGRTVVAFTVPSRVLSTA